MSFKIVLVFAAFVLTISGLPAENVKSTTVKPQGKSFLGDLFGSMFGRPHNTGYGDEMNGYGGNNMNPYNYNNGYNNGGDISNGEGMINPNWNKGNGANGMQNDYNKRPQNGGFNTQLQDGGYNKRPQNGGFNERPQNGLFNKRPQNGGFDKGPQNGGFNTQDGGLNSEPQNVEGEEIYKGAGGQNTQESGLNENPLLYPGSNNSNNEDMDQQNKGNQQDNSDYSSINEKQPADRPIKDEGTMSAGQQIEQKVVDKISKMPEEQQTFWMLNKDAIEQFKNNPQNYGWLKNETKYILK